MSTITKTDSGIGAQPRMTTNWGYKTIKLATKGFLGGKFDESKLDAFMNQLGSQCCLMPTGSSHHHFGSCLRTLAPRAA